MHIAYKHYDGVKKKEAKRPDKMNVREKVRKVREESIRFGLILRFNYFLN